MLSSATSATQIAKKYQRKTDIEHILTTPDTYIGSVEQTDDEMWVLNEVGTKIVQKKIQYIPALYKLFDEGITNARDHVVRMKQAIDNGVANSIPVSYIDVSIDETTGTITMENNGNGIDVVRHPEHDVWIPEMIFGQLRTSTNYDKDEKKLTGGKNGFGFKLVLIWSLEGTIETVDHIRKLKYQQTFKNNLTEICPPVITKSGATKPYTRVSFTPDYARLGITGLTPDMLSLLKKRIYDITTVTDKQIKVRYNTNQIPIKNFQQYTEMYFGGGGGGGGECEGESAVADGSDGGRVDSAPKRIYEEADNGRWEYAVAISPTQEFIQISFVNGICTFKGGKHVEYILGQITRKMVEYIEKKRKIKVNPNNIKEQIILFVRADIENPSFDSQTKECLNTPYGKFGSTCVVSDKFIEKIAKLGIMDGACAISEIKETKNAKKMDGVKSKSIRGIPKLMDANWAGTERSGECILIFCEGDSAKAGIVSGLSSEDRNTIGVYPMKGKILNVRGELPKKINENKEIMEIKKILGLEIGKEYTQADIDKSLRYGKVMFMTDADLDGSHIKGLCINLFHAEWASLTRISGFIGFMNTPILKAKRGGGGSGGGGGTGAQELLFYNNGEYDLWKDATGETELKKWNIKYYKGLGTSTAKEFRDYFRNKKIVGFEYSGAETENAIDMVFNKKRPDDRKIWLGNYNRNLFLDTNRTSVSYDEFIHKELIHFSKYDCDRSIPNLMDGLKISLRKILYSAFKKNLTTEIKVAQFSGYVSEHSGYHHGEASLNMAIKGMAQNFVGSNNINLFDPLGQFGGRLKGGKDSASERYIFTKLNTLTRFLFPALDDTILTYLDDDGQLVEPVFYAPIIPMVLVNGTKGIGTGFSTDIAPYNPIDIIHYLQHKLLGASGTDIEFVPYYEGFKGTVEAIGGKFLIKGKYENLGNDRIRITELPVETWTDDFKEYLEELIEPTPTTGGGGGSGATGDKKKKATASTATIVKDYNDMSKDTTIDFTVILAKGKVAELENTTTEHGCNGIEKLFKLYTTVSTTNMHLFNADEKLHKYSNAKEIIDEYFNTRLALYEKRKQTVMRILEKELMLLSNKAKYIRETIEDVIDLRRKKIDEIVAMLKAHEYDGEGENRDDYRYLIKMPMDSVCEENVNRLLKERENKMEELRILRELTPEKMWLNELDKLLEEYMKYKRNRELIQLGDTTTTASASANGGGTKKKGGGGVGVAVKVGSGGAKKKTTTAV